MSFRFTDEQQLLRDTAREYLTESVPPKAVREALDAPEGSAAVAAAREAVWSQIARLGWLAVACPEPCGGAGLGAVELAILCEAFGHHLAPLPFLPNAIAVEAILRAGDATGQARWLPPLAAGDATATVALGEECAASEPLRATRIDSGRPGWTLSGRLVFVPDAPASDWLVAPARVGEDGPAALFVVPLRGEGVRIQPMDSMDRLRRVYGVELAGVALPEDHHLAGGEMHGADPLHAIVDLALVCISAEMVGGAERCLEAALAHAKTREQFGRPIGANQAIKHKCADMLLALESARSISFYAAWAVATGSPDASLAAAMAKAYAGDAYRMVSAENIQIHGGAGFTWEYDCHLHFKRARSDDAWLGDARFHRERVAQLIGI